MGENKMLSISAWIDELSKNQRDEFVDNLIKFGFDKIEEDASNCNINYILSSNPVFLIQEHTDCNDFILYGENNSIDKVVTSIEELNLLCVEYKIKVWAG